MNHIKTFQLLMGPFQNLKLSTHNYSALPISLKLCIELRLRILCFVTGKFAFSNQPEGDASTSLVDFVEAAVRNSKFHTFLYILKIHLPKNKRGSHQEEISVGANKNSQRRSAPSSESPSHHSASWVEGAESDNTVSVQAELLYPLSRNVLVAPLKCLSRLAILRSINGYKNVNKLKLNAKLEDYCLQCPFYNQRLVFEALKLSNCSFLPQF